VAHNLGYARISTADQDPQLQLDALAVADCLKIYTDTASGTKADRPRWNACLADLRPGDTLIIWKIARLGRNLRDLIDIVTTLQARDVGVRSLTNGIVDTTTANGKLVFGMFALMAEYEAALIKERTQAGLAAARVRGRTGGRKPKMTPTLIDKAQRMYDARQFTMAEIAHRSGRPGPPRPGRSRPHTDQRGTPGWPGTPGRWRWPRLLPAHPPRAGETSRRLKVSWASSCSRCEARGDFRPPPSGLPTRRDGYRSPLCSYTAVVK